MKFCELPESIQLVAAQTLSGILTADLNIERGESLARSTKHAFITLCESDEKSCGIADSGCGIQE